MRDSAQSFEEIQIKTGNLNQSPTPEVIVQTVESPRLVATSAFIADDDKECWEPPKINDDEESKGPNRS